MTVSFVWPPRLPLLLRPLAHREFALLWGGQTISLIGNFAAGVALPWQVLVLTGSAIDMGIVTAVGNAVTLVLLLVGGTIVDRVSRRVVLLASDFGSAVFFSVLAWLGASGALRVEHLYVFAALNGAALAFFTPAISAILPQLVPQAMLVQGNVLRSLSRQGARILGPLLGGALILAAGPTAAFAFDAATFGASFLTLLAIGALREPPRAHKSFVNELVEGLRFTFSRTWLWVTAFGFALINAAFVAPWVGLPILVRDVLHGDATALGLIGTAFAIGEIAAGLALGQQRVVRVGIRMYALATLMGIGVAAMGLTGSLGVVLLAVGLIGAGFVGFGVLWDSALQRHVPAQLLGRVVSVDTFGAYLLGPISPLVGGVLIAQVGPSPIFVAGGALAVALCAGALLVPSIRTLD